MKKNVITITTIIILFIALFLLIIPHIKIRKNNKIKYISWHDDTSRFDENSCYDESMSYYEDWGVTVKRIEAEKKFLFYVMTIGYEEGNLCDYEFYLEEEYINNFIENAKIEVNEKNIDLKKLIENKKAIVGNKRYSTDNEKDAIEYTLDGEYNVMFVFYVDDLLVIQVGFSDEGPKFIAYK